MTDRFDVCTPRPKRDGGTYWCKIGAAFPSKSGDGFNVIFDALPLPDKEGRVSVSLFPSNPRDGQRDTPRSDGAGAGGRPGGGYDEGDIPFVAEGRI